MVMNHEEIRKFLGNNKNLIPYPGLHPDYVIAESYRDNSLTPWFFVYTENGEAFYHPFLTTPIQNTEYHELISAYGYGGPVATTENKNFLEAATNEFKSWCHKSNVIVETIRFHPLFTNWRYYHGYSIPKRNTVYVDLVQENLLHSYTSSTRKAIGKAIKRNVTIITAEADIFHSLFSKIYYDRMKALNARNFYFFNREYLANIFKMDNAIRLLAIHNDEVIAGIIFLRQDNIIESFLSASNDLGRQLRANNLLVHEAYAYAKDHGCVLAHMGGGASDDIEDPLLAFKMGFAGKLAEFRIGKYIHNPSVYENLVANNILMPR